MTPYERGKAALRKAFSNPEPRTSGAITGMVLLVAPDRDQLIALIGSHIPARPFPDGSFACQACGTYLGNKRDPDFTARHEAHMSDVFIAYLQQGIEPLGQEREAVAA